MLTRHKGSFFVTNTETGSSNNLAGAAAVASPTLVGNRQLSSDLGAEAVPPPPPPPPAVDDSPSSTHSRMSDGSSRSSTGSQQRFRNPEQPLGVWWLQKKGVR